MWQKFRKREEPIKIYKDKGEPAPDHLPRTAVDGVISWEPVSMHWNIIVSSSGNDAMLSVTARMWRRERSCKHVFVPPPPHPTPPYFPPHLETMPCWVWPQVCQRKERTSRTLLSPPHLETMPCWVWPQVCQRKERSCQDVIFPPHPTPPNPTPPRLERMPCWVWLQVWRGFWFLNRVDGGYGIVFFWLRNRVFWFRNRLFLVAESSFFGCGIVFFWLRKRLFLVSEA